MRNLLSIPGIVLIMAFAGCNWASSRFTREPQGLKIASATPSAADLVRSLNENAQRVQALECRDVDLDCTQQRQSVGLQGILVCQKPLNFRMSAKVVGNTAVDIGSNNQEFWYWISKGDPYLFHCSYGDFRAGQARMPFPFQPDWVMEALGIAEYDPNKTYEVVNGRGGIVDLVEKGSTPQGQPVSKITRFSHVYNQWQVTGHMIQDMKGKIICAATISKPQMDHATGALLPQKVELNWPDQQIKMVMKFDQITVNPPSLTVDRSRQLFTRPNLRDVPSFDLARGPDAPGTNLQPAGAFGTK